MFYNQPLATRFGTELLQHVDPTVDPFWDTLDIAVAWVRASGMAHVSDRLAMFLRQGGRLSVIVGIDLQNTTKDGLKALLDLEQYGHSETFVYHNEAGSVFHPKLYLFRNEKEARLIVGSNNLTQAGLYVNVEAGLQVDTKVGASVIIQTLDALASWKDTTSRFAMRLDPDLLDRLSKEGYVPEEAVVREEMRERAKRSVPRKTPPIFGSRYFGAPSPSGGTVPRPAAATPRQRGPRESVSPRPAPTATTQVVQTSAPTGTALLMRLRKASLTARPTQTQIPIRIRTTFFANANSVQSAHSGDSHVISAASARGGTNTMKLEIPEMRNFVDPVARFEKTPKGIVYEVYDVGSPQGNQIKAALEEGRPDGRTQFSVSNVDIATWWLFI